MTSKDNSNAHSVNGDLAPQGILTSMLETLNLSFDQDMGMLNGDGVRNIPKDLKKLYHFRQLINELVESLDSSLDPQPPAGTSIDQGEKQSEEKSLNTTKDKTISATEDESASWLAGPTASVSTVDSNQSTVNGDLNDKQEEGSHTENNKRTASEKYLAAAESRKVSQATESKEDLTSKTAQTALEHKQTGTPNAVEDEDDDDEDEIPISKRRKFIIDKDKMENDPQVKNPKSEFVLSQTLPRAAALLGLFDEKKGLEATGEEYLKQKYAVASYPTQDLTELLPGRMPDLDLSNPKPTNQIQFTTWLSYVDPFFRSFTEKDQDFLKEKYVIPASIQKKNTQRGTTTTPKSNTDVQSKSTKAIEPNSETYDPEVTPFLIPKIGPLYSDVWLKEDNNKNIANITLPCIPSPTSILPKGSSSLLNDNILDIDNQISCGPLASRLISAILKEEEGEVIEKVEADEEKSVIKEEEQSVVSSTATTPFDESDLVKQATIPFEWKLDNMEVNQKLEYLSFEEKLKQELRYVGIYMNDEEEGQDFDWVYGREDDEISAELRQLQDKLRVVQKKNYERKQVLKPIIEKYLAWQEYQHILDDLDKQVDQVYVKRVRAPKSKKKKHTPVFTSNASSPSIDGVGGHSNGESLNSTSQAAIQAAHQQAANQSLRGLIDKRKKWINNIGPLFGPNPELMKRMPKETIFQEIADDERNVDSRKRNKSNQAGSGEGENEEEEEDVFGNSSNSKTIMES
ncbi:hypothetical protein ACO0QE_002670 [Hanseniaspora vineae]